MWNEMLKIRSDRKALKEFGFVMAGFFGIVGVIAAFRGKPHYIHLLSVGAAFALAAAILPRILLPLQKAWMAFSIVVGFFMSRLILTVLFYGVVTPTGILMKLFGKDILDEKIDRKAASYWHVRPKVVKTKESYENQF